MYLGAEGVLFGRTFQSRHSRFRFYVHTEKNAKRRKVAPAASLQGFEKYPLENRIDTLF